MMPTIEMIARALAWALAAAIVIFSVGPRSWRPVTRAPRSLEHFAIFALCGFGFGLGYRVAMLGVVALVAFAGVVEMLQLIAPGRHARRADFAAGAIAGCVGIMIGRAASIIVGHFEHI